MDLTESQKEMAELQKRILGLEETITTLKKGGENSKTAQDKITELENQLKNVEKEKEALEQKIWDGKDRRGKERRNILPRKETANSVDDDSWGGHF